VPIERAPLGPFAAEKLVSEANSFIRGGRPLLELIALLNRCTPPAVDASSSTARLEPHAAVDHRKRRWKPRADAW